MDRQARFFAATTLVTGILATWFWLQLREERATAAVAAAAPAPAPMPAMPADAPADMSVVAPAAIPALPPIEPPAARIPATTTVTLTAAELAGRGVVNVACETGQQAVRSQVQQQYADIFAQLQMSATEADAVSDLLAGPRLILPGCETDRSRLLAPAALDAELAKVLGPARLEQFREQQSLQATRRNMTTLGGQLGAIGRPMDEQQASRLSELILAEQRRSRQERGMAPPPMDDRQELAQEQAELEATERRFERVRVAARTILLPEQFAVLDQNLNRQLTQQREVLTRRQAVVEGGGELHAASPLTMIVPANAVPVPAPPAN